jgi:arylsulfatase A-like enzyme
MSIGRSALSSLFALFAACGEGPRESSAIRLVDLFTEERVEGRSPLAAAPPRTELGFAGAPPRFEAGPGVADLGVREGRLAGRTTTPEGMLRIEIPTEPPADDFVHAIEVRMQASAGLSVAVELRGAGGEGFSAMLDAPRGLWSLSSPLVPGDEIRTYALPAVTRPVPSSQARHIFMSPTDAVGASFAIESIRVIFGRERLASIPSGVGWQGLSEVYRESLVARSPETVRFPLEVPPRAWLDLALGTPEETPVTFKVAVGRATGGGSEGEGSVLLERTLTRPSRWEPARVDLARFDGERVSLALSLASAKPGAVGFWGAPAVRSSLPQGSDAGDRLTGVILILADTLRSDHLDLYGYERDTAPVLRRLAAEGASFRRCVAQATWTKVSSASILTSLYPSSHRIFYFWDRLPSSAVTLAEVFRDAGHATLSLSSVFFTGKLTNLQQGYDELHESSFLSDVRSSKTAREYVDRLLPWLEAHRDVPFFVFLHVFDPHDPYKPYRPYDSLFGDGAGKEEHEKNADRARGFVRNPVLRAFGMPTREELREAGLDAASYVGHERDWYDGSIRAMDAEIGRLLERLRELGLERRTLIVFLSDHGEEFLEHGRMFHGQSVYGELTRVPLVLWAPARVPSGMVVEETVETIDLFPTVLELAGIASPPGVQGRSLVPLLSGARDASGRDSWETRPAISEKPPEVDPQSALVPGLASTAIVHDGWKLIHNTKRPQAVPEYELYDDRTDPLNRDDLAERHPDVVKRLKEELEAWRGRVSAVRLEPEGGSAESLSPEELERLKSLGYVP